MIDRDDGTETVSTVVRSSAPLSIVVLTDRFPEISQTFVLDHVVGLLQAGHDVRVVSDPPDDAPATSLDTEVHELVERTHYRAWSSSRSMRALRSGAEFVRLALKSPRVAPRCLVRPASGAAGVGDVIRTCTTLAEVGAPDLYHCHFGTTGARLVEALDRLGSKVPVVTTFHGYDLTSVPAEGEGDVYRRLFDRGDLFLAVSEAGRRHLVQLGAPWERTFVQRVGVDTRRFSPVQREPRREGPLRVLSVARLVEKKGISHALDAVARATSSGVLICYTVVGDGPLRAELEAQAGAMGISDIVRFMGSQPRQVVLDQLASHDVFLAPSVTSSRGDQEGVPVVLMEAMATAMPVIASSHSGIPELVEHQHSGLLTAERDSAAVAAALHTLAGAPEVRNRYGAQGREVIEAEWDAGVLTRGLISRYRGLLGGQAPGDVSGS